MTAMRSTPGRIAAVAIGIPLLVAGIGQGAFNATSLLARDSENHQASYAWHGGTLSLDADDGKVTVRRSTSTSAVSVSYTEHFALTRPVVEGRTVPAGVQLSSRCPTGLLGGNCSVNYTILVPAGAELNLTTHDGSVLLDGVDGSVTVHAGDGRVQASDLRSPAVDVSGGDGSVSLGWASAPKTVRVSMGDGNLSLSVPPGSGPYAVTKQLGDGHSDITVAEDPKAPRSIAVEMGDGNLSIH
jgi:hypothetical protein